MSFLKFNSFRVISLIYKYRKETWIKENECIFQIKLHSKVIYQI